MEGECIPRFVPSNIFASSSTWNSSSSGEVCSSLLHLIYSSVIKGGTGDDLYQEGVIGILQACKNYNGQSLFDEKFNAFVKICIKRQKASVVKQMPF